jgi:two-component system, NarL family, nitrate/nitrite response regulator NarL
MTLRVLIVSDIRIMQESLRSALSQRDEVDVISTVDMLHAKDQVALLHPDVVLFDAAHQHSFEFMKDLVASAPHAKVVAFGVKETAEDIVALAAAGTAGYISDSAASSDVVRALELVMSDELPCSPRTAASLYRRVATLSQGTGDPIVSNSSAAMVPLSRRELQIAHLIDLGLTNKEIARQLGIEAATVKNHVHNLCEKLDVHRRGEAAARIRAISLARARLPTSAPDKNPALEVR